MLTGWAGNDAALTVLMRERQAERDEQKVRWGGERRENKRVGRDRNKEMVERVEGKKRGGGKTEMEMVGGEEKNKRESVRQKQRQKREKRKVMLKFPRQLCNSCCP